MLDVIGLIVLVSIVGVLFGLYFYNIYKLVLSLKNSEISMIVFSRIIGIFVPVWGIVMGFV